MPNEIGIPAGGPRRASTHGTSEACSRLCVSVGLSSCRLMLAAAGNDLADAVDATGPEDNRRRHRDVRQTRADAAGRRGMTRFVEARMEKIVDRRSTVHRSR